MGGRPGGGGGRAGEAGGARAATGRRGGGGGTQAFCRAPSPPAARACHLGQQACAATETDRSRRGSASNRTRRRRARIRSAAIARKLPAPTLLAARLLLHHVRLKPPTAWLHSIK